MSPPERLAGAKTKSEFVRRVVAIVVVAGMLVGAGVVTALAHRARLAVTRAPSAAVSYVEPYGVASSTAWYCAGPLPLGQGLEHASIAVANISGHDVHGEITYASSNAEPLSVPLFVRPRGQSVIALPRSKHVEEAAATVLADASGIGVSEMVTGPLGSTATPCVDHTVRREYLASGSTQGSSDISLSLYDPGATPAVASVSFATRSGVQAPASFQGVPIAPGSVVILHVGHAVPQERSLATSVSATGGKIVVGALLTTELDHKLVGSLVNATPAAASMWYFGGSPAGGQTEQVYTVFNPTSTATSVGVTFSGSASRASAAFTVPARATASFDAPSSPANGVMSWAVVATKNRASPVVVGKQLLVESDISTTVPVIKASRACTVRHRRRTCTRSTPATFALPSLLHPGYSIPAALPEPELRWLIPGGESVPGTSELLLLANPGSAPAHVEVLSLDGHAYRGLSNLVLAGKGAGALDLARLLPGVRRALPIVVSSNLAIVVNAALYSKGSSVFGFDSFAGIPFK